MGVTDGIKEADRKVAVDDARPKVHKESKLVKSKSSKAKVQEGTAAPVMRATEGGERLKPDVNDEDKGNCSKRVVLGMSCPARRRKLHRK